MKMGRTFLSFNPYCYWSYLLTLETISKRKCNNIEKRFNPYCYWSYLLTLNYEDVYRTLYNTISFNPYCYWSYLLTLEKISLNKYLLEFQSLLLLVLSFNYLWEKELKDFYKK